MRLLLSLSLIALATALGAFPGRSGNMVLSGQSSAQLVLLDEMDGVTLSHASHALRDTNVANLISHLIGTSALNELNERADFPESSLFRKARANLWVGVHSTDAATATPLAQAGRHFTVSSSELEPAVLLANIATGRDASWHGIVGRSWLGVNDKEVIAYADGQPHEASIVDMVQQSFAGNSFTISASRDTMLAAPFAGRDSSIAPLESIVRATARNANLDATTRTYTYNGVAFPLEDAACDAFFYELTSFEAIIASVDAKLNDCMPDLFFFTFSTIDALNPEQRAAALSLVERFFLDAYASLQRVYEGRVVAQFVMFGVSPISQPARQVIANALGPNALAHLPNIYTRVNSKLCSQLSADLAQYDLTVDCPVAARKQQVRSSTTTVPTTSQVSSLHIVLWTVVFMVFMFLGGIYYTCGVGIDVTKDTLLYRQTRRHAKQE